jgi:hypothetical protein
MITCKSVHTGGLGRFGNQCFSIASTIGIALRNNQPYAFPEWINQDNALFGDQPDRMSEYFVNPLPPIPEGLEFTDIPYHWEYRNYDIPTGNWNICSHLQDERYFKHCMPLIWEIFRMKDEPEQNDCIAIHYRAGDYIDDQNAYHPRCSIEYYNEAIKYFPEGSKYLLFSDDIKGAVEKFGSNGWTFDFSRMKDSTSYIEDFRLMKRCKSFITANSSFSAMAAILGEHPEKKIICPRRWFGAAAGSMSFDGYPENAIVI